MIMGFEEIILSTLGYKISEVYHNMAALITAPILHSVFEANFVQSLQCKSVGISDFCVDDISSTVSVIKLIIA